MSLVGSTIARADVECKRKFSFRVWNSQTRQCVYYSAGDEEEYGVWFSEVIKGAEQQANDQTDSVVYYFGEKKLPQGSIESMYIMYISTHINTYSFIIMQAYIVHVHVHLKHYNTYLIYVLCIITITCFISHLLYTCLVLL